MSVNLCAPISPIVKIEMFDGHEKIVGLVEDKIQVIMCLPNIDYFSSYIQNTINTFSKSTECFIITASKKESINKIIKKYELPTSIVSVDFKKFANLFNLNGTQDEIQKSLIIIDKNCQVAHKTIL